MLDPTQMRYVSDITTPLAPIGPDTLGEVVYERFQGDPTLHAIPVVDLERRPIAIVQREKFMIRLAAEFGRALYARRPISKLMDDAPLTVEAATPLSEFTHHSLVHQATDLTRGFVVVENGIYRGVGSLLGLLQATAADNAQQLVEMTELSRRLALAESKATAAHQRLLEAVDTMPESLAFFDEQDRIVLWNAKYEELHPQYSDRLTPGIRFLELIRTGVENGDYALAPDEAEDFISHRLELHNAESSQHEQALRNGRWLRVEERRTPGGGVVSVCMDITEIKHREASFRLLFAANPVPMWVLERDTRRFLAVNDAAVAHYGYSAAQFAEMTVFDILPPDEAESLTGIRTMDDWQQGEGKRVWRHVKADGSVVLAQPYLGKLDYEGKPAYLVAVIDVTEARQTEEALSRARDAAEAANRAKSEFLANMSHEIRTPLNGVMGVAEVLVQTELAPRQREMVEIIASSAGSLLVILSDLLDVARVEAGRLSIQDEPYELRAAVKGAWSLAQLRAEEKGLRCRLEVDDVAPAWVRGDDARLKQILNNLLSNAVKFTTDGELALSVGVDRQDDDIQLTFAVSDSGMGIAADALPNLFNRFAQADSGVTRRFGGSGLGLAISRDLAELMGGSLVAQSAEGEGSTFTLRLPLRVAESIATPAAGCGNEVGADSGLRVLLAEDNPINVTVVGLILETIGVDLTWVENGKDAVDMLEHEVFDIVLMDLQMPVMDGLTAIAEIRRREAQSGRPAVPVIVLSANAMPEDVQSSLAAGAHGHLSKPISAADLIGGIGAALAQADELDAALG